MSNLRTWLPGLGLAISAVMAFSAHSAFAQITPDTTLPTNSKVTTDDQDNNIRNIDDGTRSGKNLFHSFSEFSLKENSTAQFRNATDIQNIITRVTGKSFSDIQGTLKAEGAANLFLINPNGIVFGPKASLQIGGSFIGSTASSVNFADGTKFSATNPQTTPLLTVSVPIGLQFGPTAASITNQSQTKVLVPRTNPLTTVGLQVKPEKTLALVGGDITLSGGNLTAESGRIELGSVAPNSLVSLNSAQGWSLGYEDVENFQDIKLITRTDNASVKGSLVNTRSSDGSGGAIQLRGRTVELSGNRVRLLNQTGGAGQGQDIEITTKKLIVQDGAQVTTSTSNGKSGNLTVNASESVELIGSFTSPDNLTGFFTSTNGKGRAGDISITTGRLRILNGARIEAASGQTGGRGGDITVNALESVEIAGKPKGDTPSLLSALTRGFGNAGTVNITTEQLTVRDGGVISLSVTGANDSGIAGILNVSAGSILLDNKGILTADTVSGGGGNINLQVQKTLLMRGNSQISTSAGTSKAPGNGGNITINAPNGFIVATPLGNNDITANAFYGTGGNITIDAKSVYGFVPRTGEEVARLLGSKEPDKLTPQELQTSDITAFSQQNPSLNGAIQINTPDTDPKKLAEMPANQLDVARQIAAACGAPGKLSGGSFTNIGRGGILSNPTEVLTADAVLTDWISLSGEGENHNSAVIQKQQNIKADRQIESSVNSPEQIVEAQGWVIDARGNVVLVAHSPTVSAYGLGLKQGSCAVR